MANPRDILKTKDKELVLEKFFNEYIAPWYMAKTISAVTYERARKEIGFLKGEKGKHGGDVQEVNVMANPRDILTTRHELVLEKFFIEYITPWYRDRAISTFTYEKARNEIVLLKKKRKGEKHDRTKPEHRYVETPSRPPVKRQPYSKAEVDSQSVMLENCQLKMKVNELKEKLHKIRADACNDLSEKERQIERLNLDLEKSKAQVDDLTVRLNKLRGDSDMTDLSDPVRPTELGRRFSEIYDNEWVDAYENISLKEEEKKIRILHGIVTKTFSFCEQKFKEQTRQVQAVLLGLTQASVFPDGDKTSRTKQVHNYMKALRKQLATETAENVANEFLSPTFDQYISGFGIQLKMIHGSLRNYARKCAELCWLMQVCDPPMALSVDREGQAFNTDVYRPYTISVRDMRRPVVKYLVWPALQLHAEGPVVATGFAQPGEKK